MNAIIEAIEHDNTVADADQALEAAPEDVIDYDQKEGVTVKEAVDWANQQRCPVTLYLYDDGKGTTSEGHFDAAGNRFG
ncbi:hypothetical protein [Sphingobium sp. D43FB]|uniref:hypothetical protein n=1 Tax=Sphingobium sp. D43FB TaxID=2017595 RepID=UPI0020D18A8B|nr:hypothetical protein [Sphingobium sp. D43FB]